MSSTPAEVELIDIDLAFGGLAVLTDVSFTVEAGAIAAVIGPNGAGKTSIFNCLSGIYRPDGGQIFVDGEKLTGRRPPAIADLGVARTFQNLALFDNLDVVDNLMLGRHRHIRTGLLAGAVWIGRAKSEEHRHRAYCDEIVELLELGAVAREPVGALPYGTRKRIEIGRALAMEPRVLLLDEPVAGMNTDETAELRNIISAVHRERPVTIMVVEHDMAFVGELAEEIIVLDHGEVIASGDPTTVRADPEVIRAYLGGA
ncbi:MAG: ABC transporter ATP-binding protein [Acidimicrobiales bacterium]